MGGGDQVGPVLSKEVAWGETNIHTQHGHHRNTISFFLSLWAHATEAWEQWHDGVVHNCATFSGSRFGSWSVLSKLLAEIIWNIQKISLMCLGFSQSVSLCAVFIGPSGPTVFILKEDRNRRWQMVQSLLFVCFLAIQHFPNYFAAWDLGPNQCWIIIGWIEAITATMNSLTLLPIRVPLCSHPLSFMAKFPS